MSEKLFVLIDVGYGEEEHIFKSGEKMTSDEVVEILNNQQATIIELQKIVIDLKDDKNQLHKVIIKLTQEVAELKTRNAVLSSKLNQIPKSIKMSWLEDE